MSEMLLLSFEIVGTIAFAVSGALLGLEKQMDILGISILGLTTAVCGGVIRDMMAGDRPYIFVKHFYASASIIGALACVAAWHYIGSITSMFVGTAVVIVLRLCAARFRWSLPK